MTWEIAAIVMCGTVCYTLSRIFMQKPAPDYGAEIIDLQSQLNEMKNDRAEIKRLADETHKMISQANLGRSLTIKR